MTINRPFYIKTGLILILFTFTISSCKKDKTREETPLEDDGLTEESSQITALETDLNKLGTGTLKANLDTNDLKPMEKYMVFFKSSFQKPLVDSYTGDDDGKAAASELKQREFTSKVKVDYPEDVIADTCIKEWFSVLSCGFAANLTPSQVKKLYRDDRVDYISREVLYEPEGDVGFTAGTEGLFVHGYKKVTSTSKKIWILDAGCDLNSPYLNLDPLSKNFYSESMSYNSDHGTRVALVAGGKEYGTANTRGVAEGARIVMVKIGLSDYFPYSLINKGLEYCWIYSKRGDIVNLSFSVSIQNQDNGNIASIIQM